MTNTVAKPLKCPSPLEEADTQRSLLCLPVVFDGDELRDKKASPHPIETKLCKFKPKSK